MEELQLEVNDRQAAERQKAIDGAINATQLAQTLVEIEHTAAAKRVEINATASKAYADFDRQRLEGEKKLFLESTSAFLDNLQKRLDLRKQLEERTTGLVEAGQIFDPSRDTDKIKKQFTLESEGFALLLDKGRPWRDLQEQIFAKDQTFQEQGFAGFASAIDTARTKFRDLGIDTASIDASELALSKRLGDDLPAAINRADPAMVQLTQRFQLMREEIRTTTAAMWGLVNSIAAIGGSPSPLVLPPIDIGPNPQGLE